METQLILNKNSDFQLARRDNDDVGTRDKNKREEEEEDGSMISSLDPVRNPQGRLTFSRIRERHSTATRRITEMKGFN